MFGVTGSKPPGPINTSPLELSFLHSQLSILLLTAQLLLDLPVAGIISPLLNDCLHILGDG